MKTEDLQELGARMAEHLPGLWDLGRPPGNPHWMIFLTRADHGARILVDDRLNIVAEVSTDGPLAPLGKPATSSTSLVRFKTRLRDGKKIAESLVRRLGLRP